MDPTQLATLNSLVTFAAENVPGGLTEEEQEVAQIVGAAALMGSQVDTRNYEYKEINASNWKNVEGAANDFAQFGWRLVAVVSDTRPGYAHTLIFERPVEVTHPDAE